MALLPILRTLKGSASPHSDMQSVDYYDAVLDALLPVCERLLPRIGGTAWTAQELALDVAQDALAPLVRRASVFTDESEVTAYLVRAAGNLALRHALSGGGSDRIRLGSHDDHGELRTDLNSAVLDMIPSRDVAIRAAWDGALASLPAGLQRLARLRFESEMTGDELARVFGVSRRTIVRYLAALRPSLERALRPYLPVAPTARSAPMASPSTVPTPAGRTSRSRRRR